MSIASLALPGGGGQSTTLNATTTSVIITGNVTNGITATTASRYDTLYLDGTSVANVIQGVISDSTTAISGGGNATVGNGDTRIIKQGTGTWTLAGNNTYVGPTVVNGGNLTITGTLGNTTVTVGAGQLNLNNASAISLNTLTLNNAAAVVTQSATNALSGTAALTQSNGLVTLSQANNYNGTTTLSGGTLQLQNANSIQNSALTLSGGTLQLQSDTNNTTFAAASTTVGGSTTINVDQQTSATGRTLAMGNIAIGANTLTVTNGNNYNLTLGTVTASAGPTFTNNMTSGNLTLGALTSTAGSAQTATFNGNSTTAITRVGTITQNGSNALALTKAGNGTLILTGANTYTGTTNINAGTLQLGDGTAGNDGSIASTSMTNNGTLYFNLAGNQTLAYTISGTGNLIKTGAGTLTTAGVSSTNYSGSTWIQQGKLYVGQSYSTPLSRYTIDSGASLDLQNGGGRNLSIGSLVGAGSVILKGTLTLGTDNTSDAIFSGTISGLSGGVTKNGTGTQTLSGNNTYNGTTTINSGTLALNHASAIGNSTLTIAGGTIDNTSAAAITISKNNLQNWNGDFAFAGTRDLNLGTGAVTMNASRTVTVTAGNLTVGGAIAGAGFGLTKSGNGTLILSGANTYDGATTIDAGTLQIGNAGATGSLSTSSSISNNGTLVFNRSDTVTQSLNFASAISGTGNLTQAGSGTLLLSGDNTYAGTTTISSGTLQVGAGGTTGDISSTASVANNGVLIFNRSDATSFGAGISGSGAIVKSGVGVLTLSGNNTNSGSVEVNGGILLFSGADALSTNISSLSGASGAVISVADGTTRTTQIAGTLSLNASSFSFDLNGASSDRLDFTGAATLTGTNIVNLDISSFSAGTWTLLTAASGLDGTWSLGTSAPTGFSFSLNSTATALTLIASTSTTDYFWTGSASSTWAGVNWSSSVDGSAPFAGTSLSSANDVKFAATGAGNLTTTLGADYTVKTLTITTDGVSINGANTLTVNSTGPSAISIANDAGTTTINAALAGSAGLTKSSNGTLVLGGSNSYSGGTVISGGTIQIGSDAALGNSSSGLTFAVGSGNATLQASADLTLGSTRTVAINSSTAGFDTQGFTLTVNSTIGGGGALEKTGSGTLVLNANNTYSGGTRINAGNITISGGSALSDSGSVTLANTAGTGFNVNTSETIGSLIGGGTTGGTITIASGQTLTVSEAFTNTFAGVVMGSGGLTKAGIGTLTLNGSNTYTGATTINAGTLVLSGSLNGSNVSIAAGLLNQSASGLIEGSGTTVSVSGGAATLNGNNTYTGGTTLSSGQLNLNHTNAIGNGGLTLSGGTLDNTSGAAITLATNNTQNWNGNFTFAGSRDLNLGTGAVSMNATRTVTVTAGNLTVGGAISGVGFGLTKNGTGTLVLAGANTYTGTTTLNAGTLSIYNANAIGTGTLVIAGGTLNNTSGAAITLATNNAQSWNGNFAFAGTNDLNLGTGAVSITAVRAVTVNSGNLTVGGVISGAGGLNKLGSGTMVLAGASTYSGATTLSAGTLNLDNANAIGTGTLSINGTGTINNTSGAAITLATNNAQNWNSNFTFAGTNDLNLGTGAVIMNASRTVTISAGNLTVGGAIAGTSFGLTKNGSGALILSGNNTYTGATTINAGTLEIGNTGRLGGGNYSANIANSGTFIYSGTSNQTLSGIISSTGALTQNGSGTLILAGNNTYTGATTINAGNISINSISALGSTSGVNLANATALLYTGGDATLDRNITVTSGTGTIRNTGAGLLTLSGSLVKNGTTLTFDTGSFNVSGVISGSSANSDLVVDGASVTLNTANIYNGPTRIIDGGTLTANVSNALPTANGRTAVTMDATGTGSSTLALGASQSIASLTGNTTSTVTLGSNTLTVGTTNGTTTTYSGRITGTSSSALVKDGASTQVLSGNNSAFTGTTTINSGTLEATATNALGSTTVINVNGGSFLVTAENAINDNAAINLNGGRMAVSGTFNESVGALTLSANSTLDFAGFVGTLRLSGIGSWASGANLAIWNWSGTTQYGTQINNYATPSNLVFTNNSTLTSNLANISFYSDSGNSFVGSGFEVTGFSGGGSEIIAVPETETYFYAIALLAGVVIQYLRCRAKRKPLEGHRPA